MEQLAQETYSWQCRIVLQLAVIGREDQLVEALWQWVQCM